MQYRTAMPRATTSQPGSPGRRWRVAASTTRPRSGACSTPVALLAGPFAALGSTSPALDALLAANAVIGLLSDYLWRESRPTKAETEHIIGFCIRSLST